MANILSVLGTFSNMLLIVILVFVILIWMDVRSDNNFSRRMQNATKDRAVLSNMRFANAFHQLDNSHRGFAMIRLGKDDNLLKINREDLIHQSPETQFPIEQESLNNFTVNNNEIHLLELYIENGNQRLRSFFPPPPHANLSANSENKVIWDLSARITQNGKQVSAQNAYLPLNTQNLIIEAPVNVHTNKDYRLLVRNISDQTRSVTFNTKYLNTSGVALEVFNINTNQMYLFDFKGVSQSLDLKLSREPQIVTLATSSSTIGWNHNVTTNLGVFSDKNAVTIDQPQNVVNGQTRFLALSSTIDGGTEFSFHESFKKSVSTTAETNGLWTVPEDGTYRFSLHVDVKDPVQFTFNKVVAIHQ